MTPKFETITREEFKKLVHKHVYQLKGTITTTSHARLIQAFLALHGRIDLIETLCQRLQTQDSDAVEYEIYENVQPNPAKESGRRKVYVFMMYPNQLVKGHFHTEMMMGNPSDRAEMESIAKQVKHTPDQQTYRFKLN